MASHLAHIACCLMASNWAISAHDVHQATIKTPRPISSSAGDPLFLTPLIQDGQFELARRLSRVGPLRGDNVPSYSGYLTVNETTESNLFFWFFPALNNAKAAATLLWLQGGPGYSSLFGLFIENGPYEVSSTKILRLRNTTWSQQFNMLYIDSPVGSGYSFTRSDRGYATNQTEVGRDLFEALQQFFTLFSEYSKNDFYITGESYGGKYVPAIAYTIHQRQNETKMKLKGVAIVAGFYDPVTMINYADFLEQIGLLDLSQAAYVRGEQDKALKYIQKGDYVSAFHVFNEFILGINLNGTKWIPYLERVTGIGSSYNFLWSKQPAEFDYYESFVQTTQSRKALHVGEMLFNDGLTVKKHLQGDYMRSVKPWVAELMNNYKVMLCNGQLDIIVAAPQTASFLKELEWDGAKDLHQTERIIWRNLRTGEPVGYVRQVKQFTEVVVRNAGHILPYDQPEVAYDMIDRFVNDKPFD